jgi:hypothetical protein
VLLGEAVQQLRSVLEPERARVEVDEAIAQSLADAPLVVPRPRWQIAERRPVLDDGAARGVDAPAGERRGEVVGDGDHPVGLAQQAALDRLEAVPHPAAQPTGPLLGLG